MNSAKTKIEAQSRARRAGALGAAIEPVRVSLIYRMALALGALGMIGLWLGYMALIGGVGYGVYWCGERALALASEQELLFGAYLGVFGAGLILLFFMIKPLFNGGWGDMKPHALSREREPKFFEFVEGVCKAVRAPAPRRIYVNCEPNASAGFLPGPINFLGGRLVLTIGLPLLGGFDQRQLAGVLAHEFGHFAQGATMRANYIIRMTIGWFARVVYERDRFDALLIRAADESNPLFGLPLQALRLFVWTTRGILWVFMRMGLIISGFLSRQMEFDADRYEARVAGSEAFAETTKRLMLLGAASAWARQDLELAWKEKRLGDDFAAIMMSRTRQMPQRVREAIDEEISKGKSSFFDTHPPHGVRIRRAEAEESLGIFEEQAPAAELIDHFAPLAKRVTLKYYRSVLGDEFAPRNLVSSESFVAKSDALHEEFKAMRRFFQGVITVHFPLQIRSARVAAPYKPKAAANALLEAREKIASSADKARAAHERMKKVHEMRFEWLRVRAMYHAGLAGEKTLKPSEELEAKFSKLERKARSHLEPFALDAEARLLCALELIQTPQIMARVQNGSDLAAEANRLLQPLSRLCQVMPMLDEMRDTYIVLGTLGQHLRANEGVHALQSRVQRGFASSYKTMMKLRDILGNEPYPFEHGSGKEVSIAQYTLGDIEQQGGYSALYDKHVEVLDNLMMLYFKLLGRLAFICEQVESALGQPPLPEPTLEETDEQEKEKKKQ